MVRRTAALLVTVLLVALCIATIKWWHPIIIHASQETGTSNSASRAYDFWSGFGSDVGEATLVTAILAGIWGGYRKINCQSKGCPWIAQHDYEVDGVTHKLCRICHPKVDHKNRMTRRHFRMHHEYEMEKEQQQLETRDG